MTDERKFPSFPGKISILNPQEFDYIHSFNTQTRERIECGFSTFGISTATEETREFVVAKSQQSCKFKFLLTESNISEY